jgi:hypothetical protein
MKQAFISLKGLKRMLRAMGNVCTNLQCLDRDTNHILAPYYSETHVELEK